MVLDSDGSLNGRTSLQSTTTTYRHNRQHESSSSHLIPSSSSSFNHQSSFDQSAKDVHSFSSSLILRKRTEEEAEDNGSDKDMKMSTLSNNNPSGPSGSSGGLLYGGPSTSSSGKVVESSEIMVPEESINKRLESEGSSSFGLLEHQKNVIRRSHLSSSSSLAKRDPTSSFSDYVLKLSLASICHSIGWDSVGNISLDLLAEVLSLFIKGIGKNCMNYANQANRSEANLNDLNLSFSRFNFNLREFEDYLKVLSSIHSQASSSASNKQSSSKDGLKKGARKRSDNEIKIPKFPARIKPSNRVLESILKHEEQDSPLNESFKNAVIGFADRFSSSSSEEEEEEEGDHDDDDNGSNEEEAKDHQQQQQNLNEENQDFLLTLNELNQQQQQKNGNQKRRKKKKSKRGEEVIKRSDYYFPWMIPSLIPIHPSHQQALINNHNQIVDEQQQQSFEHSLNPMNESMIEMSPFFGSSFASEASSNSQISSHHLSKYKTTEIESSVNLTSVFINSLGHMINLREGKGPERTKPPPDSDDERWLLHTRRNMMNDDEEDSDEDHNPQRKGKNDSSKDLSAKDLDSSGFEKKKSLKFTLSTSMKPLKGSRSGKLSTKKVAKLKLKKPTSSSALLEKGAQGLKIKIAKQKLIGAVKNRSKSDHHHHHPSSKSKLFSIKFSGLRSGTPELVTKRPEGGEEEENVELNPEAEEKLDSTIEDVIKKFNKKRDAIAASSSASKDSKSAASSSSSSKKPISAEFVEDDDDSSSDNVRTKERSSPKRSPEKSAKSSTLSTKAAKKLYPSFDDESKQHQEKEEKEQEERSSKEKAEVDAAKILASFSLTSNPLSSSTPVVAPSGLEPHHLAPSTEDTSLFNLGKQLMNQSKQKPFKVCPSFDLSFQQKIDNHSFFFVNRLWLKRRHFSLNHRLLNRK